ncbi:MAG: FmdB family zinc ribbon protein [Candidatus Margulisiibacteriota bacterium]|nr:hypothetical protein [Candidatus Margulisiibacteriota bacterium]
MPLYEYKCKDCGHVFEIKQSIKEDPLRFCPECKGDIERLISPAGIIFKGSGFYVTDSRKKTAPSTEIGASKPQTTDKSQPQTAKENTREKKETKKSSKPKEISQ